MRLARVADLLPTAEIKTQILVGVLEALEYAHSVSNPGGNSLGIIHRDVSPANVMISRSGEVKLVDFGIARAAERGDLSLPGALQGKFAYMSPEQASGGELDGRSDLFSVGVLGWELFCGARPFDGETNLATLDRTRHYEPGSLADACTDAPPEVVDVVDSLLAKRPEDRPSCATEAIRTLKGLFLRRGVLVGSREVSGWISEVLTTVPQALRDPGNSTFSLEEALRLPMGDGPEGSPNKTATVSMIEAAPNDLDLLELSTVAPTKPGRAPTTAELGDLPPTIGPVRRRGRLVGLLVSLNLLLLTSVAVLVWQQSSGPPAETSEQMGVPKQSPPDLAPLPRVPASPRAPAAQGNSLNPTEVAVQPASGPAQEPTRVKPVSRAQRPANSVSSSVAPRAAPSTQGGKGRVVFRFYPASSKVVLDGRTLDTRGSNVVNREISEGRHRLILIGPDGGQRSDTFQIKSGKTTNLTTLHVTAR